MFCQHIYAQKDTVPVPKHLQFRALSLLRCNESTRVLGVDQTEGICWLHSEEAAGASLKKGKEMGMETIRSMREEIAVK